MKCWCLTLGLLTAFVCSAGEALAAGNYFVVTYPPATAEGELQMGATYAVWIPAGVAKLRGVIVHQHGCGVGACKGGETAAYDLHWQGVLAKEMGLRNPARSVVSSGRAAELPVMVRSAQRFARDLSALAA